MERNTAQISDLVRDGCRAEDAELALVFLQIIGAVDELAFPDRQGELSYTVRPVNVAGVDIGPDSDPGIFIPYLDRPPAYIVYVQGFAWVAQETAKEYIIPFDGEGRALPRSERKPPDLLTRKLYELAIELVRERIQEERKDISLFARDSKPTDPLATEVVALLAGITSEWPHTEENFACVKDEMGRSVGFDRMVVAFIARSRWCPDMPLQELSSVLFSQP